MEELTNLRNLGAAVIKRAVLDLEKSYRCEECGRAVKDCARDFLLGISPAQAAALETWVAVTPSVTTEECQAHARKAA